MQIPMYILRKSSLAIVIAVILAACVNESEPPAKVEGKKQTPTSANARSALSDSGAEGLSKPDSASMEQQVAQIMDSAWTQLQEDLTQAANEPIQQAEAYAQYGLAAFGNGLAIPAKRAFELATQAAPSDVRWIYYLALIHEYLGELDFAVARLDKVLAFRKDDKPTLIRLGGVYFEQSEFEKSMQSYQRVVDQEPTNAAALAGLARIAATENNHQLAVDLFQKALEQQPNADQLYYALGLSLRALGKKDEAKAALAKRGSNEPSFNDPLFDEITGGQEQADGLWTHMTAGSQALVEGNYAKAAEEFELATVDLPEDPRSWQSLGLARARLNDLKGATQAYLKAETLSPENAEIHLELGKLYRASSEHIKAEQHLLRAIEIDPGKLESHKALAEHYQSSQQANKAIRYIESALALDPQSSDLVLSKAEALVVLGRSDEALKALSDAVNVNPKDAQVRLAYGLMLSENSKPQDGLVQVDLGLKNSETPSQQSRAHYAAGTIKTKMSNTQGALESFSEALKLDSNNHAAALELARTFLRLRDLNKAIGTYEVLIKNQPTNDSARIEAAQASLMLGDGEKAKAILQEGANNPRATPRLLGSYARLLILSTQASVKDPQSALKYAEKALNLQTNASNLETLALSHAVLGNIEEAISLQRTLLDQYAAGTDQRTSTRIQRNLARYQQGNMGRLPLDAK